jgi:hypothetical protein
MKIKNDIIGYASYSVSGQVSQSLTELSSIKLNLVSNTRYSYTNPKIGSYKWIVGYE